MADGQLLPPTAIRDLKIVTKRVMGTSVTRSQAFKRRRGSGRGGDATLRAARVVDAAIDAATSNLVADWAEGAVKFCDDTTGELDDEATDVENNTPVAYPEDAWVLVDTTHDPPRILNGLCGSWAGWDPA